MGPAQHRIVVYSYGLYSYDLNSYGLRSCGLYSYGLVCPAQHRTVSAEQSQQKLVVDRVCAGTEQCVGT